MAGAGHNVTMRIAGTHQSHWAKAGAGALAVSFFIYLTLRSVGLDPVPPLLAAVLPGSSTEVVVASDAKDSSAHGQFAVLGRSSDAFGRAFLVEDGSSSGSSNARPSGGANGGKSDGPKRSTHVDPPPSTGGGSGTGGGGAGGGSGSLLGTATGTVDDTVGAVTGVTGTEDELEPVTDLAGTLTDTVTNTVTGVELP